MVLTSEIYHMLLNNDPTIKIDLIFKMTLDRQVLVNLLNDIRTGFSLNKLPCPFNLHVAIN
jgi:hypothetical protein